MLFMLFSLLSLSLSSAVITLLIYMYVCIKKKKKCLFGSIKCTFYISHSPLILHQFYFYIVTTFCAVIRYYRLLLLLWYVIRIAVHKENVRNREFPCNIIFSFLIIIIYYISQVLRFFIFIIIFDVCDLFSPLFILLLYII